MRMLGVGTLVMMVTVAIFGLLIVALVDMLRRPGESWTKSGHNQLVWALVVIFVGLLGPVLYLVIARPALDAAEALPATTAEAH